MSLCSPTTASLISDLPFFSTDVPFFSTNHPDVANQIGMKTVPHFTIFQMAARRLLLATPARKVLVSVSSGRCDAGSARDASGWPLLMAPGWSRGTPAGRTSSTILKKETGSKIQSKLPAGEVSDQTAPGYPVLSSCPPEFSLNTLKTSPSPPFTGTSSIPGWPRR